MYPARAFFLPTLVRGIAALLTPWPVRRDPCVDLQGRGGPVPARVPARVRPLASVQRPVIRRIDVRGAPTGEATGLPCRAGAASGHCWCLAECAKGSDRPGSA